MVYSNFSVLPSTVLYFLLQVLLEEHATVHLLIKTVIKKMLSSTCHEPLTGIKPMTFQNPVERSNQLSYCEIRG